MANSSLAINQGTNSAVNFDSSNGTFTQVVAPAYGTVNVSPIDLNKQPAMSLPGMMDVNLRQVSPFVTRNGPTFNLKGQKFRFVGFNYYPLIVGSTKTQMQTLMDDAKAKGITVLRTWCFDPYGGFRSLVYPLGTNLVSNGNFETNTTGWTVGSDFSRSSDTAESGSWSMKQVSSGGFSRINTTVTVVANTDYVLTFWHKTSNVSGFNDVVFVGTAPGANDIKDGGFIGDTAGLWVQQQVLFNSGANTSAVISFQNFGGVVNAYFDKINVSLKSGNPSLGYNEPALIQIDTALDEARKRGIKLILDLGDGNENGYNTKGQYVTWANAINSAGLTNSYPYLAFFSSTYCKNIYKDFINTLVKRKNTINGIQYKDDPAIFSWELGNELRTNNFDPGNVVNSLNAPNLALLSLPGGWADEMSSYIKSIDPNHMVGFGDMGHSWQYLQDNSAVGDVVYNGTFYGVDYGILSALPNIDYLDVHLYPTQDDGIHLGAGGGKYWGQKFGYNNGVSGDGLRAQLKDYVTVAHANNKPAIITEIGFLQGTTGDNTYYPLYNRFNAFKAIFTDFLDIPEGDGVVIWHAVAASTSSSYDVALEATGGEGVTDNSNDTDIVTLINTYNTAYLQDVTPAQAVTGLIKVNGDIVSKNLNFNDSTVSIQLSDTWTGTVQFEYTIDGITWYSLSLKDNTGTAATSATAVGLFSGSVAGMNKVRVRASASITGSLTVNIQSTVGIASFGSSSSGGSVTVSGGTIQNIAGGTLGTILGIGGTVQVSGASAGTFVNLTTGTLNSGTINLGTVVGKDANAATQTGNPVPIGGTDSGGTVRTVLVNSAGAMSVSGASSGTFNNISTGTMQTLGTIGTIQNILAGTIGTVTGAGTLTNLGSVTNIGQVYNAGTIQSGTLLNSGTTTGVGTVTNLGSVTNVGMLNAGTISTLPNLPQGSINVTAGTFVMTSGTLNVGTAVMPSGTLNVGTINTGTINAGTFRPDARTTQNIVTFGTQMAFSAGTQGTVVGSASVGAGTSLWVNDFSIMNPNGTCLCVLSFGTTQQGTNVLFRGVLGTQTSPGIEKSLSKAVNAGMTNQDLVFATGAAGTVDLTVSYFISA